ncbi:ABC transporter substrate-binding protein [Euzebya pacifica]|uniref:ABC transporter substrate-binding protein n=1 Tax=Euzebya pacifica TaxID=1608957 RepID=UPI0030F9906D
MTHMNGQDTIRIGTGPWLRLLAALAALLLLTAACSSSDTTAEDAEVDDTDAVAEATADVEDEEAPTGDDATEDAAETDDSGDSADDEELVIGMGFSPRSLWANSSTAQQEVNISEQITEKLIEFGPNAEFEPRLASSWEQVDDTTLELVLEEGVTFTNGEAFNAESAVYSLEVMLNSAAYGTFTSAIASAEAVDEYTVRITTASPTGLHMAALAVGSFQYPMAHFEEVGEEAFGTAPIGTGPYILDELVLGEEVRLVANQDYWNGAPDIERVIFRTIPEPSSQLAALETGEIGLLLDMPLDAADRIESSPDLQVIGRPGSRMYSLTMSAISDSPMAEPAVRAAIKYALDVEAIIAGPLQGRGVQLQDQMLTEAYFGFDPAREAVEYDPDRAIELLAEAGYPDGFDAVFKYPSGRYVKDAEVSQVIAAQLAEVGINVTQEVLEPGTFLDQLSNLELNDMYFGGTLPPADAHYVYFQYECEWRYAYYCRDDIDELLVEGTSTADAEERMAIYDEMRAIFDEDPPAVPLYVTEDLYGATAALSGFTPWASQFVDVRSFVLDS